MYIYCTNSYILNAQLTIPLSNTELSNMMEKAKLKGVILSQNMQYKQNLQSIQNGRKRKRRQFRQDQQLDQNTGVKRNCSIKPLKNFATIVTGIRRCGKSTLLMQYLSGKKTVYYIHFEDIRLASFELKDFEKLESLFSEISDRSEGKTEITSDTVTVNLSDTAIENPPDAVTKIPSDTAIENPSVTMSDSAPEFLSEKSPECLSEETSEFYFFDEIQNVEGWEIYVRSLLDSGKLVFITGSNATLMSSELGTRLTGRNIRYELFPFDFDEFCRAGGKEKNSEEFLEYLTGGGFPEYVIQKDGRILQALLNDIIYRDLLVRHKIRDDGVVKNIITYMLSNIGNETSFNRIGELFGVAPNTVISIVNALEDAYFIFVLNKFDYSLKKQKRNPKKVYCVDNGFITHASFQFSGNKGSLLENLVFIDLRRRGCELYYHKDKHECDFVVKEGIRITKAFQVCYELNDDNFKRETDGLIEAMEEYDLDFGVILTFDQEDGFDFDGRKVAVVPLWKYNFQD